MRGAFLKELWRSISGSIGRFLAISGIVALGCGFYAGLSMSGPDMRLAGDEFFDGTNLYDIRVVSTLGLEQEQIDKIRALEGVGEVMAGMATDVMASLEGDQYAMRIMSVDMGWLAGSAVDERGVRVSSPEDGYLNRLVLESGSWPTSPDECLLSADRMMGEAIEVGDELEVLFGAADLDDVLSMRKFRVSGLVHSSAFPSNTVLGYTNLGSGTIQQYVFVSPEAFCDDLPITEAFVAVPAARDELAGSEAYQAAVDDVAERIEAMAPELAASRLASIKADAQAEVDDAQAEFDDEEAKARGELADAQAKLDDALEELRDGMAQIESGEAEYADGAAQLASARRRAERELAAARDEIAAAQSELEDGEAQLGMTQADIDAARKKLDEGRAELAAAQAAWETQRSELSQAAAGLASIASAADAALALASSPAPSYEQIEIVKAQLAGGAAAASAMAASEAVDPDLAAALAAAEAAFSGVQAGLASIAPGLAPEELAAILPAIIPESLGQISGGMRAAEQGIQAGIAEGAAKIAAARAELDESAAKLDQAQAARDELDAGWAELAQGRAELEAQEARAYSELASAQETLDAAAAELAEARAQLASGQAEYDEGVEKLRSATAEVDARLADAASQLAAARADVEALEPPDIYVLDRTKNVGLASYQDDSERIDAIAAVFPLIFFLVAALVALTTMTRMVEDERVDIGTHKALGFSTAQITAKYVAYAAIAGLAGSVIGIGILSQALPVTIEVAYAIMYNIPIQAFPLPIFPGIALRSAGIGVGVTLAATAAAAAATLAEVPAALMLPRAPKPGKRILLERIRPIWDRVSFSWKVTLRNLFRYKRRLAMTVIGIAGCTALLLTGLGLHDSIWDIIDNQYEGASPLTRYNAVVGLKDDAGPGAFGRVRTIVEGEGEGEVIVAVEGASMQVSAPGSGVPQAVSVYAADDEAALAEAIVMRDRITADPIEFGPSSVVLTEKMARRLGVGVGDAVRVFEQDEIGNATGTGIELQLTGVTENYVFHHLYVGGDAWEDAMGRAVEPDSALARVAESDDARHAVTEALLADGEVATVVSNVETIDSYRKSLSSVNMIVVVLVAAAAALAFIVLYNLTNINIIERTREIASLKVLGFDRGEVAAYVFREILLLVIVGALIGLGLGTVLEGFVVTTAEVDAVMFGRAIHPPSYLIAFALTIVFSGVVMTAMLPKLRRIDMVESLKSVD